MGTLPGTMNSPAVQKLLEQLAATIREEVQADVLAVFGSSPTPRKRGPGRPAKAASKGRAKGAKRTPEELNKLVMNVERYIQKNPGQRAEQIASALGIATKDLVLPIAKLGKGVRTKGQKRGTQYFPK